MEAGDNSLDVKMMLVLHEKSGDTRPGISEYSRPPSYAL